MRRVSSCVSDAVAAGEFPVILSGSCFAAVGVVGGLGERVSHVAWLDAHGDFNNPETAIYGYLDGMGSAIITGSASGPAPRLRGWLTAYSPSRGLAGMRPSSS